MSKVNQQPVIKGSNSSNGFVLGLSLNINPKDLLVCLAMGEQRLSEEQIAELKQVTHSPHICILD